MLLKLNHVDPSRLSFSQVLGKFFFRFKFILDLSSVYSLTFGDEPLPNLPCENGRVFPLVLLDLGDDGRRRDFRLATTD